MNHQVVKNLMGFLIRSENSLNQHIKLKHNEFIQKRKFQVDQNDNIYCEEIEENSEENDSQLHNFKKLRNIEEVSNENQAIDFGQNFVDNLWIE